MGGRTYLVMEGGSVPWSQRLARARQTRDWFTVSNDRSTELALPLTRAPTLGKRADALRVAPASLSSSPSSLAVCSGSEQPANCFQINCCVNKDTEEWFTLETAEFFSPVKPHHQHNHQWALESEQGSATLWKPSEESPPVPGGAHSAGAAFSTVWHLLVSPPSEGAAEAAFPVASAHRALISNYTLF